MRTIAYGATSRWAVVLGSGQAGDSSVMLTDGATLVEAVPGKKIGCWLWQWSVVRPRPSVPS